MHLSFLSNDSLILRNHKGLVSGTIFQGFIMHFELVDLPTETSEKLKSIKAIIEIVDAKRGRA